MTDQVYRVDPRDALAQLLTPTEAAARLRVSRSTVYELIREGGLRSLKIGSARRIPVEALYEFVAELRDAS